ncbi:MAG: hypothetical protein K6V97_14135 [Actinomycetia bacterium]|nr:hypothetical protein [Actinomycetes bacterium]
MAWPHVEEAAGAVPLRRQLTWWVLILPVAMGLALARHAVYWLDYTHVMAGALWTGADLLLGFVVGPVLRRLGPRERSAFIRQLVPRTLLYMPVVALTTGTAGWFLANWLGLWTAGRPERNWVLAALVITTILAVQGLGIMLPNNLRILREMQRPTPDADRIWRYNRVNMVLAAVQGVLQVAIIAVMAHLVVG